MQILFIFISYSYNCKQVSANVGKHFPMEFEYMKPPHIKWTPMSHANSEDSGESA